MAQREENSSASGPGPSDRAMPAVGGGSDRSVLDEMLRILAEVQKLPVVDNRPLRIAPDLFEQLWRECVVLPPGPPNFLTIEVRLDATLSPGTWAREEHPRSDTVQPGASPANATANDRPEALSEIKAPPSDPHGGGR